MLRQQLYTKDWDQLGIMKLKCRTWVERNMFAASWLEQSETTFLKIVTQSRS